jgi:hypothetical protein
MDLLKEERGNEIIRLMKKRLEIDLLREERGK